jgi:XTP/dITP diphosphohydrolase
MKALYYSKVHRMLCIADDSGLAVEPLGGLPGVRSARFAGEGASDAANNAHLLHELAPYARPWKAAFVCVATAALPNRVVAEATGKLEGEILPEGRGRDGFGFDPLFFVPTLGKTMAELSTEEKNRISHRGHALRALIAEMKAAGLLLA